MPSLSLRFDSDPDDLGWYGTLQDQLPAFTAAAGLDALTAMLLVSAVVEAVNNIIKHAYRNEHGHPIAVLAEHDRAALSVELRDHGGPMPLPLPSGDLPDDAAESGRGWRIIRSVFPEVRYRRDGGENVLTLILPAAAPAAERLGVAGTPTEPPENHP
jgi:anti-sigma regulatory factor (Ser/Thr protein kinase)